MMSYEQFKVLEGGADSGYLWLLLLVTLVVVWLVYASSHFPTRYKFNISAIPVPSLPITLTLALIVRLPGLYSLPWYDETFTMRMVSIPFANLPTAIMSDVHPPLYYLLLWASARLFGDSPAVLRLPALAFGLLSIYLAFRLAQSFGGNTPRWAALIVAFMPVPIYYSTEARQYALLAALVLAAWLAIRDNQPRLFVPCAALFMWTHNLAIFYLVIASGLVLLRYRNRWLLPLAAAWLLNLLWLPFAFIQAADVGNGFWLSSSNWLLAMTYATVAQTDSDLVLLLYAAAMAFTVAGVYTFRHDLRNRDSLPLLALIVAVPLLFWGVSVLWRPVFLARALLPVGIGYGILWAILANRQKWLQLPMLAFLALCTIGASNYSRTNDYNATLKHCNGTAATLYLDVATAFLGVSQGLEGVLWRGANDLNQSLSDEAKQAFQFVQGDINPIHGRICVVTATTPLTSDAQHQYLAFLLATYPSQVFRETASPMYTLGAYILEVQ